MRANTYKGETLVDVHPVRQQIREIGEAGFTYEQIAIALGMTRQSFKTFMWTRNAGRCRISTANKVAALHQRVHSPSGNPLKAPGNPKSPTNPACAGTEIDLWFDDTRTVEAQLICAGCSSRIECFNWTMAVEGGQRHGVFAGLTAAQRSDPFHMHAIR